MSLFVNKVELRRSQVLVSEARAETRMKTQIAEAKKRYVPHKDCFHLPVFDLAPQALFVGCMSVVLLTFRGYSFEKNCVLRRWESETLK